MVYNMNLPESAEYRLLDRASENIHRGGAVLKLTIASAYGGIQVVEVRDTEAKAIIDRRKQEWVYDSASKLTASPELRKA